MSDDEENIDVEEEVAKEGDEVTDLSNRYVFEMLICRCVILSAIIVHLTPYLS